MAKDKKSLAALSPTLNDVTNVHIEILKSAIKAQKLNDTFFWAASEMVTPAVNLKASFNSKTPFLKILMSDKIGIARDVARFVHSMEKSYELGAGNMETGVRDQVSDMISLIRRAYPSDRGMAA